MNPLEALDRRLFLQGLTLLAGGLVVPKKTFFLSAGDPRLYARVIFMDGSAGQWTETFNADGHPYNLCEAPYAARYNCTEANGDIYGFQTRLAHKISGDQAFRSPLIKTSCDTLTVFLKHHV